MLKAPYLGIIKCVNWLYRYHVVKKNCVFDGLSEEDQIENQCFANDTFWSRSSAKRHAADSCKFFFIVLLMIHFGAEAQQNVMQLTAVNFFYCFANDTFRSISSAKRHAAESCKFFSLFC